MRYTNTCVADHEVTFRMFGRFRSRRWWKIHDRCDAPLRGWIDEWRVDGDELPS